MRFMLQLFYHKIKVEGLDKVPKNTPLIVTPNHQNALLDPLLVGSFIPIPLHYLTRSDVFTSWTKPILKLFNMLPIYRIRDGYNKLSLNDAIFNSCREIFKEKGSVLIFAEGNHGKEYYLRPLTKGAARLALQSQMELNEDLMVLPVGLNFWSHRSPKSSVLIKFGKPIPVRKYIDHYMEDNAKGLITMRDAISAGMKETLIIPDESDDYEHRKKFIFQQKHESFTFQELKSMKTSDTEFERNASSGHWIAKCLNPIPFLLIHYFIKKTDDVVFHATLKFSIGLIAFPAWWLFIFSILFFTMGIKIAVLAVIVMVFGLFYSYQR